jgi:hypothetical protein
VNPRTIITTGPARRGWPAHDAWAIECEPGRLIGLGWFRSEGIDEGQFGGYRSAAFRTRVAARAALKQVKGNAYPHARVVRVRVCLDVARSGPEKT